MSCGKNQTNQKTSGIVGESHLFGHEAYHTVPMFFSFCKEHHGLVQNWVSGIGSSGCLRKDPQWPHNTGQSQANNQPVDKGILDFQTKPYIALHSIPSWRENNQEPPDLYIGGIGKKMSEDFQGRWLLLCVGAHGWNHLPGSKCSKFESKFDYTITLLLASLEMIFPAKNVFYKGFSSQARLISRG